jgi:hypothetical protein
MKPVPWHDSSLYLFSDTSICATFLLHLGLLLELSLVSLSRKLYLLKGYMVVYETTQEK